MTGLEAMWVAFRSCARRGLPSGENECAVVWKLLKASGFVPGERSSVRLSSVPDNADTPAGARRCAPGIYRSVIELSQRLEIFHQPHRCLFPSFPTAITGAIGVRFTLTWDLW